MCVCVCVTSVGVSGGVDVADKVVPLRSAPGSALCRDSGANHGEKDLTKS